MHVIMKIKHYLYNAFLIEDGSTKLVIDPGYYLKLFKMNSLIPKSEWEDITHILVTHGDPDHYVDADRIALKSSAPVVCGKGLTKMIDGKLMVVNPRKNGLKSWIPLENVHPIDVGDRITLQDVTIEGVKTQHGSINIPILGFKIRKTPGPRERTGLGAIGFKININGNTILNLGDSLLKEEWKGIKPDVLMIPIGGLGNNTWTMDIPDAVEAVKLIAPKMVIPCHYNVPFLLKKNAAPADDLFFKKEVEKMDIECKIIGNGDEINI
jgi:L-ascorbate metabolism protein UlaG (beta-lactamase superfamily)